jgi:hypothetical protein
MSEISKDARLLLLLLFVHLSPPPLLSRPRSLTSIASLTAGQTTFIARSVALAIDPAKENSAALAVKRTIPTEQPPLVGEVFCQLLRIQDVAWSAQRIPSTVFSVF